jgi:hypothetical protein
VPVDRRVRSDATRFALGLGGVTALMLTGRRFERRINDVMRRLWDPAVLDALRGSTARDGLLYKTRTSKYYRGFFYSLTHWVLPTFLAAIFYLPLLVAILWLFDAVPESIAGWSSSAAAAAPCRLDS